MSDHEPINAGAFPDIAPPEHYYPGLSPQLLARIKQLWSSGGLDFDRGWRRTIRDLPGFRAVPRNESSHHSAEVDLVFLFDQCLIWTIALHRAAARGRATGAAGLTPAQWHGLAAVTARLNEQLAALRLLALNDLPMPAMQIARSVSEDVDMALVILMRRKLAQRFAECRDVEEASDFWRRHIAGGRAFRTVSEKLYTVGIDHSADTDYARWRKEVLGILGTATHSNALSLGSSGRRQGAVMMDDSLHFATFRLHELCAYALLVSPELRDALCAPENSPETGGPEQEPIAALAGPLSMVLINQIPSLAGLDGTGDGRRVAAHV